jgi:hypothetical protein
MYTIYAEHHNITRATRKKGRYEYRLSYFEFALSENNASSLYFIYSILGRPRHRMEDDMKLDLRETDCENEGAN